MFDTHCHLNFKRFKKNLDEVISKSKLAGIKFFVIPGTDVKTSIKSVEISKINEGVYSAVGIHPHHIYKLRLKNKQSDIDYIMDKINSLAQNQCVVAIGEVGVDKHIYVDTIYGGYFVDNVFIKLQKDILSLQIKLAIKHHKSLILHNREATRDLLEVLNDNWSSELSRHTVFHCCEPNNQLLEFAKKRHVFIGLDGDITYDQEKQDFIRRVPLRLLVLETDSPYLLPEPLKSKKLYPNTPANLEIIAQKVADILNKKVDYIKKITTENGLKLFNLNKK